VGAGIVTATAAIAGRIDVVMIAVPVTGAIAVRAVLATIETTDATGTGTDAHREEKGEGTRLRHPMIGLGRGLGSPTHVTAGEGRQNPDCLSISGSYPTRRGSRLSRGEYTTAGWPIPSWIWRPFSLTDRN